MFFEPDRHYQEWNTYKLSLVKTNAVEEESTSGQKFLKIDGAKNPSLASSGLPWPIMHHFIHTCVCESCHSVFCISILIISMILIMFLAARKTEVKL